MARALLVALFAAALLLLLAPTTAQASLYSVVTTFTGSTCAPDTALSYSFVPSAGGCIPRLCQPISGSSPTQYATFTCENPGSSLPEPPLSGDYVLREEFSGPDCTGSANATVAFLNVTSSQPPPSNTTANSTSITSFTYQAASKCSQIGPNVYTSFDCSNPDVPVQKICQDSACSSSKCASVPINVCSNQPDQKSEQATCVVVTEPPPAYCSYGNYLNIIGEACPQVAPPNAGRCPATCRTLTQQFFDNAPLARDECAQAIYQDYQQQNTGNPLALDQFALTFQILAPFVACTLPIPAPVVCTSNPEPFDLTVIATLALQDIGSSCGDYLGTVQQNPTTAQSCPLSCAAAMTRFQALPCYDAIVQQLGSGDVLTTDLGQTYRTTQYLATHQCGPNNIALPDGTDVGVPGFSTPLFQSSRLTSQLPGYAAMVSTTRDCVVLDSNNNGVPSVGTTVVDLGAAKNENTQHVLRMCCGSKGNVGVDEVTGSATCLTGCGNASIVRTGFFLGTANPNVCYYSCYLVTSQ